MDTMQILDVFRSMVSIAIRISGPMLIMCMVVGIVMAIFQAVTQIHEQSLAFIMKVTVVILFLSLGGSWMLNMLHEFARSLFQMM